MTTITKKVACSTCGQRLMVLAGVGGDRGEFGVTGLQSEHGHVKGSAAAGLLLDKGANANQNVELMDWSAFDGFRRPPAPIRRWTWTGVGSWQDALEAAMRVRRADLAKRRQEWDAALRDLDLRDPSAVDRRSFGMLRLKREEDWSDWLAQLIADSKTGSFAEQFFGGTPGDSFVVNQVRREMTEEGRRADIVVEWQDSSYTHLEVKVGDSNLAKTFDTAKVIERRFQGHRRRGDFILFLPAQRDDWDQCCRQNPDLINRVATLTWVDAARALRLALRQSRESPAWRVWAHTFCGAIEQKLLGIPAGQNAEEWALRRLRLGRLAVATELLRTGEANETR